jgi:hypothetical protein
MAVAWLSPEEGGGGVRSREDVWWCCGVARAARNNMGNEMELVTMSLLWPAILGRRIVSNVA